VAEVFVNGGTAASAVTKKSIMRSPIFQTVERNGTGRFVVWVYDD